jgi:NADH-quinone oxidoreductase subunit I
MLFQISEKVFRVLKALKEPRIAIKDVVKEPAHKSPIFRGRHRVRYDICTGCDACNKICPVDAIKMKPLPIKRPNKVPEVNLAICIFCGLCEDVCPTKPEKAIKLSGGDIKMVTHDGTHDTLENFWVRVDIPEEWIEKKKKEEEEKARKRAEMLAKKKAEAEAKKKAETETKQEADTPKGEEK